MIMQHARKFNKSNAFLIIQMWKVVVDGGSLSVTAHPLPFTLLLTLLLLTLVTQHERCCTSWGLHILQVIRITRSWLRIGSCSWGSLCWVPLVSNFIEVRFLHYVLDHVIDSGTIFSRCLVILQTELFYYLVNLSLLHIFLVNQVNFVAYKDKGNTVLSFGLKYRTNPSSHTLEGLIRGHIKSYYYTIRLLVKTLSDISKALLTCSIP